MKLSGKTAVITGGSSGIGLATAKLFVEEGAHVYITGRRPAELDKAAAFIGRNVSAVQGDVSNLEDLDRLYAQIRAERGGLDIIVTSAAFVEPASLAEVTPEHFDRTFGVNARGTFFAIQKALPLLRDGSSIVLVSSIHHMLGAPTFTTYAATKAAVRSFARTWAATLKDRGIRVNSVSPGATETPMLGGLQDKAAVLANADLERAIPLGRVGKPEELARAVLFLASGDGSFTTGADLVADGGASQL